MDGDCLGTIERGQRTSRLIFQDSSLLHEPDHARPCQKGCSWLTGVGGYVGCDHVQVCIGTPFSSQAGGTGLERLLERDEGTKA